MITHVSRFRGVERHLARWRVFSFQGWHLRRHDVDKNSKESVVKDQDLGREMVKKGREGSRFGMKELEKR